MRAAAAGGTYIAGHSEGMKLDRQCGTPGLQTAGDAKERRGIVTAEAVRSVTPIRCPVPQALPGMGSAGIGLLLLLLLADLTRGCLRCDPTFSEKFASYQRNMNWKSWWIGDRTAARHILQQWPMRTLQALQLNIAPEIPQDLLHSVANKVYEKLDTVYKEFMYKPGIFPQILNSVLKAQILMLRDDIIQSRLDCEQQCGIYQYETISCVTCNSSVTACFGYNCRTAEEWEMALSSLPKYIEFTSLGMNNIVMSSPPANPRFSDLSGKKSPRYVPWMPSSYVLLQKGKSSY
ncbi:izumo sperm-egg fusion protein 4 isoform X2 [Rhinatrema bivittatum]|uniref:izumo sperm-egg fusion protein 4 isoform X2 n=1 Tax=Rhinatrema bivittatum TaxID=194408 RepID=UPI00112B3C4B|nr:izumo sperm-egg fusion protein 4 isoform X2 [Rhinatrema bivittatum]